MPTKYLHRDGLAIHYEHTGTSSLPDTPPPLDRGRFLLFLHGVGGNGRLWSRQLQHFATAHSPLALDLPGHGRSGGLDGPASVGEAASTVAGFLDGIGAPPALVVGHGLGGQIALAGIPFLGAVSPVAAVGAGAMQLSGVPYMSPLTTAALRQGILAPGRVGQLLGGRFAGYAQQEQ